MELGIMFPIAFDGIHWHKNATQTGVLLVGGTGDEVA